MKTFSRPGPKPGSRRVSPYLSVPLKAITSVFKEDAEILISREYGFLFGIKPTLVETQTEDITVKVTEGE